MIKKFALIAIFSLFLSFLISNASSADSPACMCTCFNTAAECSAAGGHIWTDVCYPPEKVCCCDEIQPDPCICTCVNSLDECTERGGNPWLFMDCIPTGYCCCSSSGGPLPLDFRPPGSSMLISEIAEKVIDYVFQFSLVLLPIVALWSGFLFMTAAGNPEQTKTARKIITWAIIGFLVILLAKAIASAIGSIFSV
jgi:hypothetical protein